MSINHTTQLPFFLNCQKETLFLSHRQLKLSISSLYQFFIFLCLSLSHRTNTSSSRSRSNTPSTHLGRSLLLLSVLIFMLLNMNREKKWNNVVSEVWKKKKKVQSVEPLNRPVYRFFSSLHGFSRFGRGPVLHANRTGLRSDSWFDRSDFNNLGFYSIYYRL
jgi:hypothetical protein